MITAYQVLKNSGAGRDYPTTLFCMLIPQIEQELVRTCLGSELWDFLVSKLTPVPTGVTIWNRSTTYALGATVDYYGTLFTSEIANNTVEPGFTADWTEFEMFTDEWANYIWDKYLIYILAMSVYNQSLARATFRVTAGGVTVSTGDGAGMRSGNMGEIQRIREDIDRDIQRATTNFVEWMSNNAKANGLPELSICGGTGCNVTARGSRRWNFRTPRQMNINSDWA